MAPIKGAPDRRHFEIIGVSKDHVTLRPVLGGPTLERPIRDLEDHAQWSTGWLML